MKKTNHLWYFALSILIAIVTAVACVPLIAPAAFGYALGNVTRSHFGKAILWWPLIFLLADVTGLVASFFLFINTGIPWPFLLAITASNIAVTVPLFFVGRRQYEKGIVII